MRVVENVNVRLVIRGASPLFRPFFLGGLGLLALGVGCILAGPIAGRPSPGPPGAADGAASFAGLGAFLATFGFFVALVPLVGRFPVRREIIVDRAAGTLVRRDRTLIRLRQETYPADQVRGVDVVELRHVDGDAYYNLSLRLESGESATLDRFTDRDAATNLARLIREHLATRGADAADPAPG